MHTVQNYTPSKTKQAGILVWQTQSYSNATDTSKVKELA